MLAPESTSMFVFIEFPNLHGIITLFILFIFVTIVEHCSFRITSEACFNFFWLIRRSLRNFIYFGIWAIASINGMLIERAFIWSINFLCSCSNSTCLFLTRYDSGGWYNFTNRTSELFCPGHDMVVGSPHRGIWEDAFLFSFFLTSFSGFWSLDVWVALMITKDSDFSSPWIETASTWARGLTLVLIGKVPGKCSCKIVLLASQY